ncbi:MAG: zinc-ribbon domain-containing protein [Clostridiales bacterium]|jgi:hypothetical protein|nr:zinc-ribbon domain-containing protein [Clostridiales bacterium]
MIMLIRSYGGYSGYGGYGGYNDYDYSSGGSILQNLDTITTVVLIASIIAAIFVYFLFLNPKNEGKFVGFKNCLYNFLNFRSLFIEAFFKILYIALTATITIVGVITFFYGFSDVDFLLIGLLFIVFGNLFVRILFEYSLILIMLFKNTSDIRKKLIDPDSSDNPNNFEGGYAAFDSFKTKMANRAANYIESNKTQHVTPRQNVSKESAPVCKNCNSPLPDESDFCPNCGAKQND